MKPSDLGLPPKFVAFRAYPGFDQLAVAQDLATHPARFQIANLPTGSGKSLTYATAAKIRESVEPSPDQPFRWLVLTGTKGLQAQLLGDGLVRRSITGHRNYPCAAQIWADDADANDPEFRCAVPRERCGWLADVAAAVAAQSVVTNYAFWLAIGRWGDPDLLGEFDLIVMDEGHTAPKWLTDALTIILTPRRLMKALELSRPPLLPGGEPYQKVEKWKEFAQEWGGRVIARRRALGPKDPARRKLDRLAADLAQLLEVADPELRSAAGLREPWIVRPFADKPGAEFIPRWGSDFAERLLFRGIPRVILTSATVTREHSRYLGISQKEEESRFMEVPSPFDVRRRPVIWLPTVRVDFRMTPGAKWQLFHRVDELIETAITQGAGNLIIHTGSYAYTRELLTASRYRPLIMTHEQNSDDFNRVLARFKEAGARGQFAVLASPRMQEGVDLPGPLCRGVIVLKCPFPDSRDPLTAARARDSAYRDLVVAETMMQMCGRANRGKDDWATVVVLDDHWGQHVSWRSPFPAWFKVAFRKWDVEKDGPFQFLTQEVIDRMPTAAPWQAPRPQVLIHV